MHIQTIDAKKLTGPRSYFTDIDPKDKDYNEDTVIRKLKLQLLTKEKIVIAASALFHDVGFKLFSNTHGLNSCLEEGIIVPAIRDEFPTIDAFFDNKKDGYSTESRTFFKNHTSRFIPWNLYKNTNWFRETFYKNLLDDQSLLRKQTHLSKDTAGEIIHLLDQEINCIGENGFLQRGHIDNVGKKYGAYTNGYLNEFANLIYRISGSKVVNSEVHFPQANLIKVGLAGNEAMVSDDNIFWDIYVEAVISSLTDAIKITPERIDRLDFNKILCLRQILFEGAFAKTYDQIITLSKTKINLDEPDSIILKQAELNQAAIILKKEFREKVTSELGLVENNGNNGGAYWQIVSGLSMLNPTAGIVVGTISLLDAIPEITPLVSQKLGNALQERYNWMKRFVSNKIGWSQRQKTALIDGYTEIAQFGLPRK